jgi:hypothetical protein
MQNTHQTEVDAKLVFLQKTMFNAKASVPVKTVSLNTIDLVELSGIEPLTPCLQSRCSPS